MTPYVGLQANRPDPSPLLLALLLFAVILISAGTL